MPRSRRSAGVTAAAIVAMAGSALMALFCLLIVLSIFITRNLPRPGAAVPAPPNLAATLAFTAVFYGGLAAWGFATSVGLLRLRAWARASILVFSGLLAFSCVCCLPVLFIISRVPELKQGPPGAQLAVASILATIIGSMAGVSIWWLVLFSLKSVRAQFDETGVVGAYSETGDTAQARAMKPRRPVSITVIGCLYVLGAPGAIFGLVRPYPALLLGYMIEGNAARLVYLLHGAIALVLGLGLLKLKPWARILAICLTVFYGLGAVAMYFHPESMQKMLALVPASTPPEARAVAGQLMQSMLPFSILLGALVSLAILWFLITSKDAFTPRAADAGAASRS
ncbi:MAG TPA: hypothetical protein VLW54_04730 [Candidatus Acidoferrales bacterium]|nr:hypothetical protein [Candidatus Acidoferrales bacterium]